MGDFLPPFSDPDMPDGWEELPEGYNVESIGQINKELFDRLLPLLEEAANSFTPIGISKDFNGLVIDELNTLMTKIDIETLLSVLYHIEQTLWDKCRRLEEQLKTCSDETRRACEKYRLSVTSLYSTGRKIDQSIADENLGELDDNFNKEGLPNIEQSLGETFSRIRTLQFAYAGVYGTWKNWS